MSYDQILVDGNFMARRMFSIHKRLSATVDDKTYMTGLAHGFLSQLVQLKREHEGRIIVVWDAGIKRRRAIDKDYKRKRHEQEWEELELFLAHRKVLMFFLKVVGVRQARKKGEEGDDLLYTLAMRHEGSTLMVTNDHDLYQAVTEDVHMLVSKKGTQSLWTPRRVLKSFGVTPEGYGHSMCLSGCRGDQVSGVEGIGAKTALTVCARWPMLVPVMLGYGYPEGYTVSDWLPETDKKNIVVKATSAFGKGDKGPDRRLMKILESGNVIGKTHKLVKLYNVWPVTFKKRRSFDPEIVEDLLDRCEMQELSARVDRLSELSE